MVGKHGTNPGSTWRERCSNQTVYSKTGVIKFWNWGAEEKKGVGWRGNEKVQEKVWINEKLKRWWCQEPSQAPLAGNEAQTDSWKRTQINETVHHERHNQ